MISVENDLVKVNRYLAEVETMICNSLDLDQLRKRPVCSCGFQLGEILELMPIRQIEETIDKGLNEYLAALKEPRYQEQIMAYTVSLEEVGKRREAEKLKKILEFNLSKESEVYIKIRYKAAGLRDHLITELVGQIFPELIPLIKETGEELFQHLLIASAWAKRHSLPVAQIFQLFGFSPGFDFDVEIFADKCRKVFNSLDKEKGRGGSSYLEETERFIVSRGINHKLLDLLVREAEDEELLDRLSQESMFIFSARGLCSVIIKRLDSEREPIRVKGIRKIFKAGQDRAATARPTEKDIIINGKVETDRYKVIG